MDLILNDRSFLVLVFYLLEVTGKRISIDILLLTSQ